MNAYEYAMHSFVFVSLCVCMRCTYQLYRQGRFPFDRMITFYDSLSDVNRAVEETEAGSVVKPVLRISRP